MTFVAEVTVEYFRGLPQVTVPLPSRRERCRFTLKPISNTVGDFLAMLCHEDRGIDRVAVSSLGERLTEVVHLSIVLPSTKPPVLFRIILIVS